MLVLIYWSHEVNYMKSVTKKSKAIIAGDQMLVLIYWSHEVNRMKSITKNWLKYHPCMLVFLWLGVKIWSVRNIARPWSDSNPQPWGYKAQALPLCHSGCGRWYIHLMTPISRTLSQDRLIKKHDNFAANNDQGLQFFPQFPGVRGTSSNCFLFGLTFNPYLL